MSYQPYLKAQGQAEPPRLTEARAFALVTGKLIDAEGQDHRTVIEACQINRELWTILQMDLLQPENALPDNLKAQLISLAIFVFRHTSKVIRKQAGLGPLIDINKQIMEGLRARPTAEVVTRPETPHLALASA